MKQAKTLKCLLCLCCLLAALCAFTLIANAKIVDSGTCGEHLTWEINEDYVLTIAGTGDMEDYDPLPKFRGMTIAVRSRL